MSFTIQIQNTYYSSVSDILSSKIIFKRFKRKVKLLLGCLTSRKADPKGQTGCGS